MNGRSFYMQEFSFNWKGRKVVFGFTYCRLFSRVDHTVVSLRSKTNNSFFSTTGEKKPAKWNIPIYVQFHFAFEKNPKTFFYWNDSNDSTSFFGLDIKKRLYFSHCCCKHILTWKKNYPMNFDSPLSMKCWELFKII